METTEGREHLTGFTADDQEVLVRLVKECQRRNASGRQGTWKQHLAAVQDGRPGGITDPARRPWHVLAKFLETLTDEEDIQLVGRIRAWHRLRKEAARLDEINPWPLSKEQELVLKTQKHPNFANFYSFPSYLEGWVLATQERPKALMPPGQRGDERLLALDCEMVVGEGQSHELVSFAIVDKDCQVLASRLVKPGRKVVDWKTSITGFSSKDLEGVIYTQADAQKEVLELLKPGTILVGHGLHHDLKVLKIDHQRVIDTSLIYQYKGLPDAAPALSDLCQLLLGKELRKGGAAHSSQEDAVMPMLLVHHATTLGSSLSFVPPPAQLVDKADLAKLFIHKVPRGTPEHQLAAMFHSEFPVHIQMITWGSAKFGSTHAVFKNPEHANQAFKLLQGGQKKDALGRAQKLVKLCVKQQQEGVEVEVEVEVNIRKMACHNGMVFGADPKREAELATEQKKAEVAKEAKKKAEAGGEKKPSKKRKKTKREKAQEKAAAAALAEKENGGDVSGGLDGKSLVGEGMAKPGPEAPPVTDKATPAKSKKERRKERRELKRQQHEGEVGALSAPSPPNGVAEDGERASKRVKAEPARDASSPLAPSPQKQQQNGWKPPEATARGPPAGEDSAHHAYHGRQMEGQDPSSHRPPGISPLQSRQQHEWAGEGAAEAEAEKLAALQKKLAERDEEIAALQRIVGRMARGAS